MASYTTYVGICLSSERIKNGLILLGRSDEADVFLETRGTGVVSNTERNALVSGKQTQKTLYLVYSDQKSVSSCTGVLPGSI